MPSHSNVFQILLVFQEFTKKKPALILAELVLKCIEDTKPFPWPIKSLDLREKQYLKLRSLSPKQSHHGVIEKVNRLADSFRQNIVHTGSKEKAPDHDICKIRTVCFV